MCKKAPIFEISTYSRGLFKVALPSNTFDLRRVL